MRLRDTIDIAADVGAVWPFVADPVLQSTWNPKIVALDRERTGPAQAGERFSMIYRMSSREAQTQVEVAECRPPQRIVFRHRFMQGTAERGVEEAYDLAPGAKGVRVTQTLDLSRAGIPLPFRLLIRLVYQFGRPVGERYLEQLKRLVEQPPPA